MPSLSTSEATADRRLVRGLNDGDDAALAVLYDEYGERLYDYALSMSGDAKLAADIVHDTFIDAWRRAPRMRDHLHLSSWLYGAARRRALQHGRASELYWDRDGEFSDIPFLDEPGAGPGTGTVDQGAEPDPGLPPSQELHGLLRASLARLDLIDQEVMLLAFRHGLRPARLGAALGLSSRRAAVRVRKARCEMEAALDAELRQAAWACASVAAGTGGGPGTAPEPRVRASRTIATRDRGGFRAAGRGPLSGALWQTFHRRGEVAGGEGSPEDPAVAGHAAVCPHCRRRLRTRAIALLRRAPAPVLPAALRHRVMHTATDPELLGYRIDIAARGGALTPEGLPSQPDVASPFTRRWFFTGGGMAGALLAALVAVFVMGPGIDGTLLLPFQPKPQPRITHQSPTDATGHPGRPSDDTSPGTGPGTPVGSRTDGKKSQAPSASQSPSGSPSTPPGGPDQPGQPDAPVQPGELVIAPGKIELKGGAKTAQIQLTARGGAVTWTAMTSTSKLVLSEMQGGMSKDGSNNLTITLKTLLIGLPGQGTLTFTDSEGATQQVTVAWGASLL